MKINTNDFVTIFPNERGIAKMIDIVSIKDNLSHSEATDRLYKNIEANYDFDLVYRDQLWRIINYFGEMFFNGQNYFANTSMIIEE